MNEELKDKLGTILDLIVKGMTTVGDFVMEQLPDIAQQYVAYGRVWNTGVFALLALVTIYWLWNVRKVYFTDREYGEETYLGLGMLSVVLCLTLVPATFIYAKDTAMVWYAPKIWLIKEAAEMVKPKGERR